MTFNSDCVPALYLALEVLYAGCIRSGRGMGAGEVGTYSHCSFCTARGCRAVVGKATKGTVKAP
jgi:hypothetical protein